jgi:hypothetical protein
MRGDIDIKASDLLASQTGAATFAVDDTGQIT